MPSTKASSVRVSLPALDLNVTPEVVSQITQWLPQVAQVAMRKESIADVREARRMAKASVDA